MSSLDQSSPEPPIPLNHFNRLASRCFSPSPAAHGYFFEDIRDLKRFAFMIIIAPNLLRPLKLNELINLLNVKTFRVLDKERSAKIPHAGMVSEGARFAKGGLF